MAQSSCPRLTLMMAMLYLAAVVGYTQTGTCHTPPPTKEALVALPLALPMGWNNSPPILCSATKTIVDLTNQCQPPCILSCTQMVLPAKPFGISRLLSILCSRLASLPSNRSVKNCQFYHHLGQPPLANDKNKNKTENMFLILSKRHKTALAI